MSLGAKVVPKHPDPPWSTVMWTITNPRLLLLIGLAECPQVGLRRDFSSAGRRFDPYTAHQILQQLPHPKAHPP